MRASNEAVDLGVEPTWDIAKLFPDQGAWSEEEYLMLPGNRLVEYSHGIVEVLPMPSYTHQMVVAWLYELLREFIVPRNLGRVIFAPLRVRLWAGKYREPDLMVMLEENRHRIFQQYWDSADLVMEIVSPDDPARDLETKRREYAVGGIREYWLVNPINSTIVVFTLPEGEQRYEIHGVYLRDTVAESVLLPGFKVDVTTCFKEAEL